MIVGLLLTIFFLVLPIFIFWTKKRKPTPLKANLPLKSTPISLYEKTFGRMLQRRVKETPMSIAIYEKYNGVWEGITWNEVYQKCLSFATYVNNHFHLCVGSRLCVLGPTRAPWAVIDLSAHLGGMVPVGLYQRQTERQYKALIEHCGARLVFVSGEDELQTVLRALSGNESVQAIVAWEDAVYEKYCSQEPRLRKLTAFFSEKVTEKDKAEIERRLSSVNDDDMATIVYTSGTTAEPKGCVLTHKSIISLLNIFQRYADKIGIEVKQDDTVLSFLPMSHVAERVIGFYFRLATAMPAIYPEDNTKVLDALRETSPTRFGCVPRVLEKAYLMLKQLIGKLPCGDKIFKWIESISADVIEAQQNGTKLSQWKRVQYFIIDTLIFSQIRKRFGQRIRSIFIGAAPTPQHVLRLFLAAKVPLFELYGATELSGATHANYGFSRKTNHFGTQGQPGPGVEQKTDPTTGELLIKGDMLFKEYFKDPIATKEAFTDDGYYKTGDIADIDEDGFITIKDRLKNIIITSGGKNISPSPIEEDIIKNCSLLSHAVCCGEGRKYITAILSLDTDEIIKLEMIKGIIDKKTAQKCRVALLNHPGSGIGEIGEMKSVDSEIAKIVLNAIRKTNLTRQHVEHVNRVIILSREFTIEKGELTPTLKPKRKDIERQFKDALDLLYDDGFFENGKGKYDAFGLKAEQYLCVE